MTNYEDKKPKMKKFFQDDEQDLVSFIRQHRPLPPSQNPHLENQVMELINQTSSKQSQENYFTLITTLSGTIVVGLVVTWSSSRWSQQIPQIAIDQDTVETFLINTWENTIDDQNVFFSNEQEADWFFSNTEKTRQVLSHSQ